MYILLFKLYPMGPKCLSAMQQRAEEKIQLYSVLQVLNNGDEAGVIYAHDYE